MRQGWCVSQPASEATQTTDKFHYPYLTPPSWRGAFFRAGLVLSNFYSFYFNGL
jgi:hypothetical protein